MTVSNSFSIPEVYKIYKKLYDYYGKQNWWPADSEFEVMVGAVLTQNTAWRNVEKAIKILKDNKVLSPQKIVKLSVSKLGTFIRPSGFYNIKAIRLKALVDFVMQKYSGDINILRKQKLSVLRAELLNINGIGQETADSILLYALDKPIFVIDAYTKRIFSRHNYFDIDSPRPFRRKFEIKPLERGSSYSAVQEFFLRNLPKSVPLYQEYHALLVRLAKDYCRKTPNCIDCPVKGNMPQITTDGNPVNPVEKGL